jgi:predicted TIM-barrel fold metal-dependent hydrolase
MCREVGSDRVVFGTDLPWYDPSYAIGSVLFADITDEDRENILRNTALSILDKMGRK